MDYGSLKLGPALPLTPTPGRSAKAGDTVVTNKINGLSNGAVAISPGTSIAKVTPDTPAPQQQQAPAKGTPDVQITGAARNMAALEQQIRDLPAVNPTNVAAARQSLADGSYQIDPQRIADRLLGLERALNNGKK